MVGYGCCPGGGRKSVVSDWGCLASVRVVDVSCGAVSDVWSVATCNLVSVLTSDGPVSAVLDGLD